MEYLVTATDAEFPPFHSFLNVIRYCKISRKWISENITELHKGLHIVMDHGSKYIRYGNVFECGEGIFIAYAYVCDGKKDCPGDIAFDEIACICESSFILSSKCKYIISKEGIKRCSPFFLTIKDGTCLYYGLIKVNSKPMATNHQFICMNNNAINLMVNNDLITECLPNRNDEKQMLLKYNSNSICQDNGQLPCKDHKECYSIKEICIYRLDKNNLLTPCRTGEHVANCSLIQCNMKFKCPGFYCIPWSYVCDGKWDCPGGYDEGTEFKCGINRTCRNMFKCRNSQKCIHVGDVCNGLKDCNTGDDEYMCSLAGLLCPSSFICIGLGISCYSINYTNNLISVLPYNTIFLNYCDLVFLEVILNIIKFPTFLSLQHNNLRFVCTILPGLRKTITIDIGFNLVKNVNPNCFENGFKLISIKLNNNLISIFQRVVIFQLKKLQYLNLNNNFISTLFFDYHLMVPDLKIISIRNNRLSTISSRLFDELNVKIIVTNNYLICCKIPLRSTCPSVKLWYESCEHLLLQTSITVCAFCYSLFLIITNAFVIFLQKIVHVKNRKEYGTFQYVALSINLTDLTWGIYLLVLTISDFIFKNNFFIQESVWKSSFICIFLFSINLNFNFLSPLLSSFMSFSRLMVVMHPLDSKFKNTKYVLKGCILMYGLAATLVTGFVVTFNYMYSSVPFRLCSPLIDPTHSSMVLTVTTCVLVCLQFSVYFSNILFNSKTILKLKDSNFSQKQSIASLLTQFLILRVSNTICWVPSGIIFVICMFIDEFSIIMVTWVVIAVTSIHPVTNSILFIVTTARRLKKLF